MTDRERKDANQAVVFYREKIVKAKDHKILMMCVISLDVIYREYKFGPKIQGLFSDLIAHRNIELLREEMGVEGAKVYVEEFIVSKGNE